jgi:hypothetical protein
MWVGDKEEFKMAKVSFKEMRKATLVAKGFTIEEVNIFEETVKTKYVGFFQLFNQSSKPYAKYTFIDDAELSAYIKVWTYCRKGAARSDIDMKTIIRAFHVLDKAWLYNSPKMSDWTPTEEEESDKDFFRRKSNPVLEMFDDCDDDYDIISMLHQYGY